MAWGFVQGPDDDSRRWLLKKMEEAEKSGKTGCKKAEDQRSDSRTVRPEGPAED